MDDILELIGRSSKLFQEDLAAHESDLSSEIEKSSFLVVGGAGSIGQALVKNIFQRNPRKLHVVDISENNLVELVRDIRSSLGYIDGDFKTFALDCGSPEFAACFKSEGPYDYVLNVSALKHVRSEKDPYTLMRLVQVNVINTIELIEMAIETGAKKFFCVSTDKAANPVNMMGASKRIMELYLNRYMSEISISTARFANVAFSDGELLHGFNQRIAKDQPLSAPNDIRRYFVNMTEAGELCLFSAILGESGDIFFPKLSDKLHLITFSSIAEKYLKDRGYTPLLCSSEDEAREKARDAARTRIWPCYFFGSDTTGEKDFEEFFTADEQLDLDRFHDFGIVKNSCRSDHRLLEDFVIKIGQLRQRGIWSKEELVELFFKLLPEFAHKETGKYLDNRM